MNFKTIAVITSVIAFILGIGYLFFGETVAGHWQIEPAESVLLFGRRIGSLYLGLSVVYFFARTAQVSIARTAISAGSAVALTLLVITGVYELASGHVGSVILVSAAIELLLAIGYIWVLLSERKAAES